MKPVSKNYYTDWHFKTATAVTDKYMTLINKDYVYEFVDTSYCRIIGKSREEILNCTVKDIWGDEIFERIIKGCIDRCFTGVPVEYEGWFAAPGNGNKYYKINFIPYKNEDGKTTYVISALWDITEAKREEEIFSKCNSNFLKKLQKNYFGVIFCDTNGRFLFVNSAVVEITGFDRQWFNNNTIFELVLPEEKDNLSFCFNSSLKGKQMHNFVFSYTNKYNERNWININFAPIKDNGVTAGVVCIVHDVTRRKEIEFRYDKLHKMYMALFENCNDAVFTFDSSGRLTNTNKRFLALLGYRKEEINNIEIGKIFTEWKDQNVLMNAISSNGIIEGYETTIKKKDGIMMNIRLTIIPLYNDKKTGPIYQGLFNDVTQLRFMEKALLNQKAQLESIICDSPIPQFMIDRDHKVVYWNKALETISRISSKEMVGTKNHWRVFYEYERPCMADLIVEGAEMSINKWYQHKEYKTLLWVFIRLWISLKLLGLVVNGCIFQRSLLRMLKVT